MAAKHGTHWLEREDFGDVTVARLKTPRLLDDDIARAVFDPLVVLVGEVGRSRLVLNLAAVEFLPSLALGKLVMLNRKAEAAGGKLVLCRLTPAVESVLEATSLTPLFTACATEEEALASFAGSLPPLEGE
jgi:anti-anti-sigma factor